MKKVRTMQEAYRVFEYLGIKDVTKKWQKAKGTEVWELPQKTMYYNGHSDINRFTIYKNGYVRKMVVGGENNVSRSCWQLNRVRKVANFVKDYEWNDDIRNNEWNGKYRKIYNNERIMIDTHRDRVVYLCNYILKNYYNTNKYALVGEYTMKRVSEVHGKWWRNERKNDTLPFDNMMKELKGNDVQVIINGHRYNLS
jgi:hypothetical protein